MSDNPNEGEQNPNTSPSDVNTEKVTTDPESDSQHPSKKSAEARINELISENKQILEELRTERETKSVPVPQVTKEPEVTNPEVDKAISFLKEKGQFVDAKILEEKIRGIQDRITLDASHSKFENVYSGQDGRPKYDRQKIEDFMWKHRVFDPEAAYNQMYMREIVEWEIKKADEDRKQKPFVAKPSSTTGEREDHTITREKIGEWLKSPEGRVKYQQNRTKILDMMAKGQL